VSGAKFSLLENESRLKSLPRKVLCKSCHSIVTSVEQKTSFTRIKKLFNKSDRSPVEMNAFYHKTMTPVYETVKGFFLVDL